MGETPTDDTARDRSAVSPGLLEVEGKSEHLRVIALIILAMAVKGLDFDRKDLIRLGYGEKTVYRAFRSLRKAKVLKKITRRNYALRGWVVAAVRKLAEEDIGRPVGWPSIHDFLFVTFGMFDWDEQRMDAFLSFLKKDWLHRMRASGRMEASSGRIKGTKSKGLGGERTYSLSEAAEKLGVAVRTIREWDLRGDKIHCVRLPSGRRRVPESEITRLLADMRD